MKIIAFIMLLVGIPGDKIYLRGLRILKKHIQTEEDGIVYYMLTAVNSVEELSAIERLKEVSSSEWLIKILEYLRMSEDFPYSSNEYKKHFAKVRKQILSCIDSNVFGVIHSICYDKFAVMEEDFLSKTKGIDPERMSNSKVDAYLRKIHS